LIGPWNFAAKRWVATRDLKALRHPDPSPITSSKDVGSFLAMYWILKGHHDEWTKWGRRQVKVLIDADRMFEHRDHVHTQMYRYEWGVNRDADGVPAELALDHPWKGLVVVWSETDDRDAMLADYRTKIVPSQIAGSGAALCLCFTPIPMPSGPPSGVQESSGDEGRFLRLYFLDREPDAVARETFVNADAEAAQVALVAPFLPTVPGTDTYTDQLW
jgi:hypothetical protein